MKEIESIKELIKSGKKENLDLVLYLYTDEYKCEEIDKLIKVFNTCIEYKIKNFTINDDYTVDVNGDVSISSKTITELPINFNKVTGDFDCIFNQLVNLNGSPKWIGGNFMCSHNKIISLKGGPEYVGRKYLCDCNNLITLEGCPDVIYNDFNCSSNYINTLLYSPKEVKGEFDCSSNFISSMEFKPKAESYYLNDNLFNI